MTWLITFSCYGTHFHEPSALGEWERRQMTQDAYELCAGRRAVVLGAVREACQHRGWQLFAAHVRSTHVHVVVDTQAEPAEAAMNLFKWRASRKLNEAGWDPKDRRRWARHGSTRPVRGDVGPAVRYVVEGQGEAMAVWWAETIGWHGEREG